MSITDPPGRSERAARPASTALTDEEAALWRDVWDFCVQVPTSIDARLRREVGISHYDYLALKAMSEGEDPRRLTELATATGMTMSHLSRVITRLEGKGAVERIADPTDRRSMFVALSDAGRQLFDDASPGYDQHVRTLLFDHLSADEHRHIGAALAKIQRSSEG